MPRVCYIPGCRTNKDYYERGVGLFSFPKDPDVLLQWKQACGKDASYQVPIGAAVCQKHFDSSLFYGRNPVRRGKSRLNLEAVPTLRLKPEEQPKNPVMHKKHHSIQDTRAKAEILDVSSFCRICTRSCDPEDRMNVNDWIFGEEDNEMHGILLNLLSVHHAELDSIKSICMLCYNEVISFMEFAVNCRQKQLRLSKRLYENKNFRLLDSANASDDEGLNGEEYVAKLSDPESENETEEQRNQRMDRYIQRVLKLINGKRKQIRCTRPWECLDCRQVFPSRASMDKHRKSCPLVGSEDSKRKGPFTCSICSKVCNTITGYRIHLVMMHDKDRKKRNTDHEPGSEDTSETDDFNGIPEELRLHKMKKSVRCPICKDAFLVMRDLKYHLMSHDSSVRKPKPRLNATCSTICNVCGKIFKNSATLDMHLKFHAKQKDWKCAYCEKRYYQRCDMITHVESVHEKRKTKCDKCEVELSSHRSLARHARLHDSNKMLCCDVCPKRFPNQTTLRYHMVSHTGEKNYKCEQCPAAYQFNYLLTQHKIRIHGVEVEGVKLYKANQRPMRKLKRTAKEVQLGKKGALKKKVRPGVTDVWVMESETETETESDEGETMTGQDRSIEKGVEHEDEVPNNVEAYVEIANDTEGYEGEKVQKQPQEQDLKIDVSEDALEIEVVEMVAMDDSVEMSSMEKSVEEMVEEIHRTEKSVEEMVEEIHNTMEEGNIEEVELELVNCDGLDFY